MYDSKLRFTADYFIKTVDDLLFSPTMIIVVLIKCRHIKTNKPATSYEKLKAFITASKTQFNADVHLFALQKGSGGRDYEFMQELKVDCDLHFYNENQPQFMSLMTSMDFNIGLRYHFAVVSLQYGIPTIGINYQPKVRRELTKFGLEDYVLEMDEVNGESLQSLFQKLQKNKEATIFNSATKQSNKTNTKHTEV